MQFNVIPRTATLDLKMFLSNYPSSGDINLSNLSCWLSGGVLNLRSRVAGSRLAGSTVLLLH